MAVRVRYVTDPACSASWAAEPNVRRLTVEFGDALEWELVMGGLGRDWANAAPDVHAEMAAKWLDHAVESRMPFDPRLWTESPPASSYPACMAVKAAGEQGPAAAARCLRALRTGLMCFRRKLDTTESLVEEARDAGLDAERFRVDLGSHAIVEAFGADLEQARTIPDTARERGAVTEWDGGERLEFPAVAFHGDGADVAWVFGDAPYEEWRAAATRAGAEPGAGGNGGNEGAPGVLEALSRFGQMAGAEVEAVCGLPEVRAEAELWALAAEWKVKPTRVLTGYLWDLA